jgi:hypothetical protein
MTPLTYRLVVLRSALRLQKKGIQANPTGTATAIMKRLYGFKGTPDQCIEECNRLIQEAQERGE